jgi:spoIIIJ-associated protein
VQPVEPSIEVTGRTVDEAIRTALARLGKRREEVEVIVLSQGSPGRVLGFGGEPARVRVSILPPAERSPAGRSSWVAAREKEALRENEENEEDEETLADEDEDDEDLEELETPVAAEGEEEGEELIADVAADMLQEMLDLMGLDAEVEITSDEPPSLNVVGEDLALLIGRRGEHLRALQFLLNLMVNKQTGRHERIIVDVENYRERRTRLLEGMARRAADEVRRRGVPIILEPMPPNERRIIHLALANDPDVTTESIYEDEKRRVVIKPRRRLPTQR